MAEPTFSKKLDGKVAIITGGASGIGEATAHLFAGHGALAVVIADIQDEKGQKVAEAIGSPQCSYVHCDVSDEEQVKSAVDWTVQTYGQLDIMFSNAGILSSSDQTLLDLDFCQFDRPFSINVRGMAASVKQAARTVTVSTSNQGQEPSSQITPMVRTKRHSTRPAYLQDYIP